MLGLMVVWMLFGVTFLGLRRLFMWKREEVMYHRNEKLNVVWLLRVIYSVGEMIGPMIGGVVMGE